jgi:hypothetical protein
VTTSKGTTTEKAAMYFKLDIDALPGTIIPTPAGESIAVGENGVAQITTKAAQDWAKENLGATETDEFADPAAFHLPVPDEKAGLEDKTAPRNPIPEVAKAAAKAADHTPSKRQMHESSRE